MTIKALIRTLTINYIFLMALAAFFLFVTPGENLYLSIVIIVAGSMLPVINTALKRIESRLIALEKKN